MRIPETRRSTLLKETGGGGTTSREQDMPRAIHKHSLSMGIPTRRQTNSLEKWHKRGITLNKIKTDILKSLIGKLSHAAHVIPLEQYFLNQILHLIKRGGGGTQRLQLLHRLDLQMWMKFLERVTTKGVPIKNIVFVKPSVTLWSDVCEYSIGGCSKNFLAWRWRIPETWHGKITLNLLDFIASAVTIYMTILKMVQWSHILSFTDSSSALGWIDKASFDWVNAESHDEVARWLGWTLVSNETYLYSKHIKGT